MGFMSPAPPPAPPPPPPPSPAPAVAGDANAAATNKALNEAQDAERRQRGRAATLLTGGQGDTSQASVSKRVLLGS